jgi:sterol carrier protein 2
MSKRVNVIGVGMTKFQKPGASDDYNVMAANAAKVAIEDAKVKFADIESAYVGYVFGDSTCGQRAVYDVGLTGIPVFNVNNNCSTGSTALVLAAQAIQGGIAECVLALGFEKMEKGALGSKYTDRTNPLEKHVDVMVRAQGVNSAPFAAQMFGGAGREYRWKYGTKKETFAKISEKARKHAANNPYALFNTLLSVEEILASEEVFDPLTRFQCCPPTCGAAAAILCSDEFAKKLGITKPIYIAGQVMTTDFPSSFEDSMMKMVGYDMTKNAAKKLYEQTGIGAEDVDVVELHDCFTANELLTYEALGLCPEGQAEKFIWDGDNTYGGKFVTNPSGGLLSKGHPLGATGLAQRGDGVNVDNVFHPPT